MNADLIRDFGFPVAIAVAAGIFFYKKIYPDLLKQREDCIKERKEMHEQHAQERHEMLKQLDGMKDVLALSASGIREVVEEFKRMNDRRNNVDHGRD